MEQTDSPATALPTDLAGTPIRLAEAPRRHGSDAADALTLELGLYVLLWTLAAALRLGDLGAPLLSADEARRALAAWQLARGGTADLASGPTLLYASSALFFLFSANDFVARLVPALAGLSLVLWPYLLRGRLGRGAALGATFLLATSPTLVHAARTLDGEALALSLFALAGFAWLRCTAGVDRRYLAVAGVTGGLALGCGPAAFGLLVPAVLTGTIAWWTWRRLPAGDQRALGLWRAWLPWSVAAAVLVSTGLFSQPQGLQRGLIDPLALWFGSFVAGDGRAWLTAPATLAAYEPAAVLAAFAGLALWRTAANGLRLALVLAGLAVLFAGAGAGPSARGLSFILFPVCLVGGWAFAALWQRGRRRLSAREAALFLAFTVPVVWLFGIVAGHLSLPGAIVPPGVIVVPAALFLLIAALWAYWRRPASALLGSGLLLALVLAVFALHGGAGVAASDPLTPSEVLERRAPAADLRNLLTEIARHSAVLSTPGTHDVLIQVDGGLLYPLAWYLRDYSRVAYDGTAARPTVAVVPADAEPPPGNYVWQRYTLDQTTRSIPRGPGELWRWFIYRDAVLGTFGQEIRLYVAVQPAR